MGNLCSTSSNPSDPFAQPGRTLSSAPAPSSNRAPVPKISSNAPGRTLDGAIGGSTGGVGASAGTGEGRDARLAAAAAAEERSRRANQPKGKLGRDLAREKQQTVAGTLGGVSQEERRRREVDGAAEVRNWN